MQRVEVTRWLSGTPGQVWDVYTDHAGWSAWSGMGGSRIERAGAPTRDGVGCIRVLGPGPLAAHEEILSFEPPKRMTYRIVRGGIPIRDHLGEVAFEPEEGGTRIVWRCRFESRLPGLGGFFRFLITRLFTRALDGLAAERFPER